MFQTICSAALQLVSAFCVAQFGVNLTFIFALIPFVRAQGDLGGTGGFNTSVLGALYGLGLAALSVERFPVGNLSFSSELWAKFVSTPNAGALRRRSEVIQLRWYDGRSAWTSWNSPYPPFNGLGSHNIVVIGSARPKGVTGGVWVCLDESASSALSTRKEPKTKGLCGGYHYWASKSLWWDALRLVSFTAEVDTSYLARSGCLQFTKSIVGAARQTLPPSDTCVDLQHLRYTPTLSYYKHIGIVPHDIEPKASDFVTILAHADQAIVSTEEVYEALGTIWTFLAPSHGRGAERELERYAHSEYLLEFPEPDFYFRLSITRIAPAAAIIPHLAETATSILLPWFGITSLTIVEQVSRKAVWSSLSTGPGRYTHSAAYGGELSGKIKSQCSYVELQDSPSADLFWFISITRLFLTISSYAIAIWVQVSLNVTLPTHDDIISVNAARASGIAAVSVHILTTVAALALIKRVLPCLAPIIAAVLVTAIVVLHWTDLVSPTIVGPVILAAEFISSMVQTTLTNAIHDARGGALEGWRFTASALCAETRIALILAVPRLAAWFAVGN
ncbi:hypothetical protein C8J56DRAFT_970246 [Mycena floridula]|nr:hypothetical protein C8J56DRAFT_970246 [Mycena floridula]